MTLENMEFLRLLPHWMRDDNANAALAQATDDQMRAISEAIRIASIWDSLDELPDNFLDALAEQLHITWYRSTAPREARIKIIRESDQMHMILGTRASVERIFELYFGRVDVKEWFDYAGSHDHFKIFTEDPALVEDYEMFLELLEVIKRQSSVLDGVFVTMTHEASTYAGVAVHEATHEVWDMTVSTGGTDVTRMFVPYESDALATADEKIFEV